MNINFVNVLDEEKKIKPTSELESLFKEYGVTKDKEVIIYCKSSVRAGVIFHVLAEELGYPKVKVYDGAFIEWSHYSTNKVVK